MALKPCRECGNEVSTEADTCPSCGVPFPTPEAAQRAKPDLILSAIGSSAGAIFWFVVLILALVFAWLIFDAFVF